MVPSMTSGWPSSISAAPAKAWLNLSIEASLASSLAQVDHAINLPSFVAHAAIPNSPEIPS